MKLVRDTGFYNTTKWQSTRTAYYDSVLGLCERCKKKKLYEVGKIVHHKIELTLDNYKDDDLAYGFDNLELLCANCHNKHHKKTLGSTLKGLMFDDEGNLIMEDIENEI